MSNKFIVLKPKAQFDWFFKSLLWVSVIIAILVVGYILEKRLNVHISVNRLSDKFCRIANKNHQYLYDKRHRLDPSFEKKTIIPTSDISLDVVIPLVDKDLETVIYTIDSIRKLVNHKVGKIYLVGPNKQTIKHFAATHNCQFIDEDKVLPLLEFKKFGGWVIQQLIKLNADQFVEQDHFLVVDADTVFLRPVVFARKKAYLVNVGWDCSKGRKLYTARILNNTKTYRYDFVPHNMLFSKKILQNMKQHIATLHQDNWDRALLKLFEQDTCMRHYFSEYEIYATYLTEFSKEKYRFVSNANITVHRNLLKNLNSIIPAYAGDYKSLSMHHFIVF